MWLVWVIGRIFSPEAPCQLMQAEQHCHVFLNCEPDIWMVMVVEKAKEVEEEVRAAALEAVLKEAHELFVMFYGSIRALLHKHPAGDVARSCLHAFMPDYFADFLTGKKLQLPSIGDGLTERGTMQPVSLERDTVLHAQVCNSESNNFLSPIHLSVFHLFQHGQIVHAYLEICKKRAWVTLYAMTLYSGLPVYLFSMKNGFSGKLFTKLLPVPVLNVLRYSSRMRLVPVSVIVLLKKKSYSSNFLLNHARDLFKKESFIFGFSSFTISK
jgi:hypothetical protein